jgi:CRISPR/Cas system-associated exonuclease Cas4 (RecB family)
MPPSRTPCDNCGKKKELNVKNICSECAVITLTVESIRDYHVCELFYRFRHKDKKHEKLNGRELMTERFENTLKKVASFFFYKIQSGNVPSYNALLNRWEKLWFPKDMTAYDIAVEQHEVNHGNIVSYSNIAAAALESFHDFFSGNESDPILIDEGYLISLGRDLRLKGSLDLVLRTGDKFEVIKWIGRPKKPGVNSLMIEMAAMRIAFEHRNKGVKKVNYRSYELASGNQNYVNIDQPKQEDVDALLYWAYDIRDSDIFVPRRGFTAYCKSCPFDVDCANFSGWPKVVQ